MPNRKKCLSRMRQMSHRFVRLDFKIKLTEHKTETSCVKATLQSIAKIYRTANRTKLEMKLKEYKEKPQRFN